MTLLFQRLESWQRKGNRPTDSAPFPFAWSGGTMPPQAVVAEAEGNGPGLAGIAWIFRASTKRAIVGVAVDPEFHRKGLGGRLLESALSTAEQAECAEAVSYVHAADNGCQTFLEQSGFRPGWHAFRLQAPEGSTIPSPEFPNGYFLRTYADLQHPPTLAALINRAHFDSPLNPENEPKAISVEILQHHLEAYPEQFPPQGMFLLFNPFGKAVGFVRAHTTAEINAPAVVPEERSLDLHRSLLVVAMAHLRAGGARLFHLFCEEDSDQPPARYRAYGFSQTAEYLAMRQALQPT